MLRWDLRRGDIFRVQEVYLWDLMLETQDKVQTVLQLGKMQVDNFRRRIL